MHGFMHNLSLDVGGRRDLTRGASSDKWGIGWLAEGQAKIWGGRGGDGCHGGKGSLVDLHKGHMSQKSDIGSDVLQFHRKNPTDTLSLRRRQTHNHT